MPKTLYFATHNKHKTSEIAELLKGKFVLKDLHELNFSEDIPETGDTLRENAIIKARFLHQKTGMPSFADDTGLEVTQLNGAPGVYSARYAGVHADAEDNMTKLLVNLKGAVDRSARFRTVIAYINEFGIEYYFEGTVEGEILREKAGAHGFGYDPIFKPDGSTLSFAQMSSHEKGKISHRARAVQQFVDFIQQA
jgi:XTP/dITP diphosphohydrolase